MNRLKKAIQWDYQHIPYFIDTNSYNDKVVWDNIQRIIRIIGFMCGGKILSATFIETYNAKCQELIDVIVSISSDQLAIETEYYLSGLLNLSLIHI